MIVSNNSNNVSWHVPNTHNMQGYWFAVEPTPTAWKTIEKIQNFVGQELSKEKITTWAPYPHKLSHVSIFLGLSEKTTPSEKSNIMRRVGEKVAKLDKFSIDFDMNQAELVRGPGNYITLQFDSPSVKILNEKVREAIKEAIQAGEFDRTHLYTNGTGTDKLDQDIHTHFTLGILDVEETPQTPWKDKHKDVKALFNKENKAKFEALFKQKANTEFKNLHVNFPVNEVELLGLDKAKVKVQSKEYLSLASCGLADPSNLLNPNVKPFDPQQKPQQPVNIIQGMQNLVINTPKPITALERIHEKVAAVLGKVVNVEFKADHDENHRPLINVGFKDYNDAARLFQAAGTGGNIFHIGDKYWVRLGQKRLANLFGEQLGAQVHQQGFTALSSAKL